MRLFIAAEVGEDIRERCAEMMESLKGSGADIRTVSPENLHITLKFLGDVREDDVKKISDTLRELCEGSEPFTTSFSTLGYFGSPRFPRTIWVGISEGREAISGLATELNERLSWVNREERKPRPHLTLARVKSPVNSERLVETIQSLRDVKLGETHVKELKLKRSILRPDGPLYSDLEAFGLGKAGVSEGV